MNWLTILAALVFGYWIGTFVTTLISILLLTREDAGMEEQQ